MIKKDNDGYYFESKRGYRYELLEGVGIGGKKCTSDIIFIFFSNDEVNVTDNMVGYLYGAGFLNDDDTHDTHGYNESIEAMVNEYERREFGREEN